MKLNLFSVVACMALLGVSQASAITVQTYDYTLTASDSDPTTISGTITVRTGPDKVTGVNINAGSYGMFDTADIVNQGTVGSDEWFIILNNSNFDLQLSFITQAFLFSGLGATIDPAAGYSQVEPQLGTVRQPQADTV